MTWPCCPLPAVRESLYVGTDSQQIVNANPRFAVLRHCVDGSIVADVSTPGPSGADGFLRSLRVADSY
jgi:hypothetical protein